MPQNSKMIRFDHVTYHYPGELPPGEPPLSAAPVLRDLSLTIGEGDFVLVVGPSGSGKSTLLRCLNGLVPHFYGGVISGHLRVNGLDPIALGPRRMSATVGFVFQDPEAQAVVDVVEDELAFALENQGVALHTMRKRIEEVLDQLDIAHLRQRKLSTLSGGERQRVAIAAVLTLHPQVLVLDEPTSQLDPQAAETVLDTLVKLNQDLGLTIVLSEHRLERVAQYADHLLYLPGGGRPPIMGGPQDVLAQIPLAPPLIALGKALGWSPLPLTIKEARKMLPAAPLHVKDKTVDVKKAPPLAVALDIQRLSFAYNGSQTLRGINLTVWQGEFVALMGRNGAGKSTLLKQCIGLLKPATGQVQVLGMNTQNTPVEVLARRIGYVPQNPNALLFADTVTEELDFTCRVRRLSNAQNPALLGTLGLSALGERYPRDLSTGERQRVALAAVLVGDPDMILLDEPTRGLDYAQKEALTAFLQTQKQRGKTVIIVTHDVELVAQCAERVILMSDGQIIVDGPVRQVMSDSQVFSSQINKLFRDPQFLTVQDVINAVSSRE